MALIVVFRGRYPGVAVFGRGAGGEEGGPSNAILEPPLSDCSVDAAVTRWLEVGMGGTVHAGPASPLVWGEADFHASPFPVLPPALPPCVPGAWGEAKGLVSSTQVSIARVEIWG